MNNKKGISFWVLILATIVLIIFLTAGQTLSLIDYDLAIDLGLQESEKEIARQEAELKRWQEEERQRLVELRKQEEAR